MAASNDPPVASTETALPIHSRKPIAGNLKAPANGAVSTPPTSDASTPIMTPAESLSSGQEHPGCPPADTLALASALTPTPFGHAMRNVHFRFAPGYLPMNHGSYGLSPRYVHQTLQNLQAQADERPDPWMRCAMPAAQRASRAHVARLLNCSTEDVVLVPNASTATDSVLRNIEWREGDVLIYYDCAYGALEKAILYALERYPLKAVKLDVRWPVPDDELVKMFEDEIQRVNATPGQRVKLLVFDTIISLPGWRLPWERLCAVARKNGALSLVDGAHGIGQISIDLSAARPDFFASNLHKWLYVPRGCAAFYINPEVQDLFRATMPISHGFAPRPDLVNASLINPLPGKSQGRLADLFEWVATMDYTPYLTVGAALEWSEKVCGGEAAIQKYCMEMAQQGAERAAKVLGTEVMACEGSVGRECALSNVMLPFQLEGEAPREGWAMVSNNDAPKLQLYIQLASVNFEDSYFPNIRLQDRWWWRISGQVYLEIEDFERAAEKVKDLVKRVKDGSWLAELELLDV